MIAWYENDMSCGPKYLKSLDRVGRLIKAVLQALLAVKVYTVLIIVGDLRGSLYLNFGSISLSLALSGPTDERWNK